MHFPGIIKVFIDNPNTDAVFGDINIIDKENHLIKRVRYLPFDYTSGVFNGFGKIISSNAILAKAVIRECWFIE